MATSSINMKNDNKIHHHAKNNTFINSNNDSVFWKCFAGGIGCGISGFVTNPMDVIKIKNQQYGGTKFGKFSTTALNLYQAEGGGIRSFFKGAASSVLREMTYSSLRMGLYEPIKDTLHNLTSSTSSSSTTTSKTDTAVWIKWMSAFLSGAIGSAIFNPVDLIKVRFQSQLPHQPPPYTSIRNAFVSIYQTEGGLRGLYNGTTPTVIRAAFLTGAQLGSYDIIKNNLLIQRFQLESNATSTHFAAALIASLATTTAANPADVVKTRVMNDCGLAGQSSLYHFQQVYRQAGLMGYMKGWTASYFRIGPHTILSFLLIERVRILLGMATY